MISGVLSVVYKLLKHEEPTFISLGVDPGVFVKLFQRVNKSPDTLQVTGPTQQQDASNLHVGDGAVLGLVVAGVAEAVVVAGDVGTSGTSQVVEQDVKMGEETHN